MFDAIIKVFTDLWDSLLSFFAGIFDWIYGFVTWAFGAMWSVVLDLLPANIRSYLSQDALGPFGTALQYVSYVIPVWSIFGIMAITLGLVGSIRVIRWVLKVAPIPGVNG